MAVLFYKVSMNIKLVNTELLFLGGNIYICVISFIIYIYIHDNFKS